MTRVDDKSSLMCTILIMFVDIFELLFKTKHCIECKMSFVFVLQEVLPMAYM